jgi:pimeloyl-ACP methyl ester carboxylesterase
MLKNTNINQENMKLKNRFLEVASGVKLHITESGKGRPVLFIHGWPFSNKIFKLQYEVLAKNGYRVVGITLRGFGDSDKPESGYDFDTYAADIDKVIRILRLKDIVLAGYSMGGAVAVQYLTKHPDNPVSQLILFSSNVPMIIQKDNFPYGFTADNFRQVIDMSITDPVQLTNIYGPLFNLNEDFMPLHQGDLLNAIAKSASPRAVTNSLLAMAASDLRPYLPGITIPVLILHAYDDNAIPFAIAEQAQLGLSASRLIAFENGGHWIFIKEPEKFNEAVIGFIREHEHKI